MGKPREHNLTSDLMLPPVIFGTSGLGNLFVALDHETKLDIVRECIKHSNGQVVFDSAGKYGAGLALEELGKCLRELNVQPDRVVISNKLAWIRTELETEEPTFEPGVWRDLTSDAVQQISYDGIMKCFQQGNELLNGYIPQMISVHDPDEYMAAAKDDPHSERLYEDILDAYEALYDLKKQGAAKFIGLGAKNWKTIRRIAQDVELDWIMIANSMTIKSHPDELLDFIAEMSQKGVYVINSAVFHSGFLVGGDYFNYALLEPGTPETNALLNWRSAFFNLCKQFNVKPAHACVQFAFNVPGVKSIALNTTHASRVKENTEMLDVDIPLKFWAAMEESKLISVNYQQWLSSVSP